MLMSAVLMRFKANYLEKMPGYPSFSLWIPMSPFKDLRFLRGPTLAQKPLYLVGTVINYSIGNTKQTMKVDINLLVDLRKYGEIQNK